MSIEPGVFHLDMSIVIEVSAEKRWLLREIFCQADRPGTVPEARLLARELFDLLDAERLEGSDEA